MQALIEKAYGIESLPGAQRTNLYKTGSTTPGVVSVP